MGLTHTVFFEETGVQDKQMGGEKLMGAQVSRHNHRQQGHQGEHAFIYLIQNNTFNCL